MVLKSSVLAGMSIPQTSLSEVPEMSIRADLFLVVDLVRVTIVSWNPWSGPLYCREQLAKSSGLIAELVVRPGVSEYNEERICDNRDIVNSWPCMGIVSTPRSFASAARAARVKYCRMP